MSFSVTVIQSHGLRKKKKLNTEKELFAVHTIWNIYSASLNARACMWKKVVRCA